MDSPRADLALHNADVITLDKRKPKARTIYVSRGRILKVSSLEIDRALLSSQTRIIDCRGRAILPGFHDAHCHVAGFAESLLKIDLSPANVCSIEDIISRIRQAAGMLPPGRWIRCTGYNEFRLEEGRHPSCRDLDRATVLHPVLLTHRSGHAHVLNTHALELAGITVESGEPEGGMIGRDPDTGEPNGILYGMGQYLSGTVPPHDERDLTAALSKAGRILLSLGITLVQDASPGNDQARWNQFIGWKRQGLFPPRVVMMFGAGQHESLQGRQPFFDKETGLGSGALKIMLDEVRGSLNPPQRELNALVLGLHRRGFQVAMHAVEEGTVEAALSALEHAHRHDANRHNRHRLEHCSICTPRTAQRIAQLGATVVTNPAFIYYSGDRYLATVPRSQMQHLYALKTMLGAGIPAAAGSDAPVAPPDPLKGIYAAVTRHSDTGRSVLPSQAIKVEQAIRLFSCEAAWSCFREKQLGTIARGKLADLAVLNANPLQAPAGELKHIKVEMTVLNGQVVYSESL